MRTSRRRWHRRRMVVKLLERVCEEICSQHYTGGPNRRVPGWMRRYDVRGARCGSKPARVSHSTRRDRDHRDG